MNKITLHSLQVSAAAAACLAIVGTSSAFAAPPTPGVYDWTGFYAGVNLGGAWGSSNWSNINVPSDTEQNVEGQFAVNHPSGVIGGVQGGYNFQTGGFVFGLAGSVSGTSASGGTICFGGYGDYHATCKTDYSWMADLTGRLGYTPIDRLLIFVKGGIAYANVTYTPATETRPIQKNPYWTTTPGYASSGEDRWGSVFGAGAEYAVMDHWTVGVEYDHYDFGTQTVSFAPNQPVNNFNPAFSATVADQVNKVIVTVNYKF